LCRNLADKVAARGYYVVAPDLFNGNPFDPDDVNRPLSVWLQDHPPVNSYLTILVCLCFI